MLLYTSILIIYIWVEFSFSSQLVTEELRHYDQDHGISEPQVTFPTLKK